MTDCHPTFVDFETARSTPGLRLVTVAGVPSLWSKRPRRSSRKSTDPLRRGQTHHPGYADCSLTGVSNAPVAMYDYEPPRSGWREILELAERLAPTPSLLPDGDVDRTRMLDLANDVCGTDGICCCARLVLIDESVQSQSERGWPPPVTKYLANKYAYSEAGASAARAQLGDRLEHLALQLQSGSPILTLLPDDGHAARSSPAACSVLHRTVTRRRLPHGTSGAQGVCGVRGRGVSESDSAGASATSRLRGEAALCDATAPLTRSA